VQRVDEDCLRRRGVSLLLKRDDLIHPDLPGNKWRKLKHNLRAAVAGGHRTLLTFGGAYSSHIRATAAAGHYFGFATVGIIRGEPHLPLNPVLAQATRHGMRLQYLDRGRYRAKDDPELLARLRGQWGDFYLLPEGGSNALAAHGCAELGTEIGPGYDVVCCPAGTGGTLAGLAAGLAPGTRAIGFPVLKSGQFLAGEVSRLQREAFGGPAGQWQLECGFHHGGYARRTAELDAFIGDFAGRHGQVLDWVYVAKMMTGIYALAGQAAMPRGSRVVAVITG
jgi:1-aminocyclopropane-1-carboxylate deaminase